MKMSSQATFAPGYTVVIYYPYNGSSPRKRLPTGVNIAAERRYYDLGSLLWFVEAWYWDIRDGNFYIERSPDIHPKAPAIYLVMSSTQSRQGMATDGGSFNEHSDNERRYLVTLSLVLAPILYLMSLWIISVNVQLINYAISTSAGEAISTVNTTTAQTTLMDAEGLGRGYA